MLVRNAKFGTALAKSFSKQPYLDSPTLDHNVVLMRRHGFTTHGVDIETAVYRGIYTKTNAGAQTNTILIRNAFDQQPFGNQRSGSFEVMSEAMLEGCQKMNEGTQDKPWALWVAEVENNSLYQNNG